MRLGVLDRTTDSGIAETERGRLHLQTRCLVCGRAQPKLVGGLGAILAGRHHVGGMQARGVGRVDGSL